MLRIYIGFQTKFHCCPSSSFLLFIPPPPPYFYCISILLLLVSIVYPSSSSSSSCSFLLLFHLLLLTLLFSSPTRLFFFSPLDSIKDCQVPSLVQFKAMSRVVNKNRDFLQLLADCPSYQRQFLLKTATPQQLRALVQVLYNILMGHIPIPEDNK